MPDVSFIIPVGSYHTARATTAIAAAASQSVPCTVLTAYDEQGHGPATARNAALSRVETPYVVMLDADDWVDRTFAERCLLVAQPDRYIYTDWYEGADVKSAPDCPWVAETWHPVTALIPTDWLRRVGGFDQTLPGAEDTDLFLKLTSSGCCGLALHEPLFHYGQGGQRARRFRQSPAFRQTMDELTRRYGGRQMACCGDNKVQNDNAANEEFPGSVLALAIWGGNRRVMGTISGILYPRTGDGKPVWVDERDAAARPDLWRLVVKLPVAPKRVTIEPGIEPVYSGPIPQGVAEIAAKLWGGEVMVDVDEVSAVRPAEVTPDVGALARLTGKG